MCPLGAVPVGRDAWSRRGGTRSRPCWPARTSHEMAEDEEPDVIINIHKGLDGYGIFFAQREEGMVVTKLDKGSEAEKAGVQPGDRLVRVQDNDGKLPMNAPGREVPVTKADYQESPAGRGCGMAAAQRPAGLRRAVHRGS